MEEDAPERLDDDRMQRAQARLLRVWPDRSD
jgi:hypothetical protein